jgi:membrane protein DedA with SNARE-associated domain
VPEWLIALFARYGYLTVFIGVLLENAGLPVPGETVLLAGAALSHSGRLSLSWVIVVASVGAIVGDNIGFAIGRRGGRRLVEQYGLRLGITAAHLHRFDQFFDRHGGKTVFAARFITGLRVVGALLAGGSGLPWPTFLFYNAAGAIVWSTAIALVGYLVGQSWDALERWIGDFGTTLLILFVVLVAIGSLRRRRTNA